MKSYPYSSFRSTVVSLVSVALALALVQSAPAQDVLAPKTANPAADETVILSPFEVTAANDKGYLSTNTASITRLALPVQELPVNVMIINPEVMTDLAATGIMELGRYIVGTTDHASANQWTFDMRGFNSSAIDDTQRDGFRSLGRPNTYNIDRLEVIMGPNSVVQGAADPGGQVNVLTKSAIPQRNFTAVTARIGSFSSWRTAVDTNVATKLGDSNLALRANAVYENQRTFIKFSRDDYRGVALAAKWQTKGAATTVDGKFERLQNDFVPWNNLIDRWSGGPGLNGGFHMALNRQIPKLYNFDEANALSGPDSITKRAGTYFLGQVTQRLTRQLNFQMVGQTATEDISKNLQGGVSPSLGYIAATNSYIMNRTWVWGANFDRRYNLRALLNYDLDMGWTQQQMIAGYSYMATRSSGHQDNLFNANTKAALVETPALFPGGVTAAAYGLDMTNRYWQGQAANSNHVDNPSYYVNSTGSYFGGKIKTIFGYSWNRSDRTDYTFAAPAAGTNYNTGSASVPAPTRSVSYAVRANIPMVSVVAAVTPNLNLYASTSKSYKPQTAFLPTLDLKTGAQTGSLGPISGEGFEGGVKFDYPKLGISGSVSGYQVKLQNIAQVLDTNIVAALLGQAASLAQRYYVPGTEQTSKGAELQLFYNPNKSLSVMLNYAYNSSYITKSVTLPALVGQEANVHFKQMGNLLAKYSWTAGELKGWFVGGNMSARGREWRIQGAEFGTNGGYLIPGVLFGYSGRLNNTSYNVQASVDNLFNKIYIRSYAKIGEPRQFSLSVDARF